MTAMGVRNSCEASEAKRFSALKECSSLSNIRSKVAARRCISSLPRFRPMRAVRSEPSEMASTVSVICRTGRKARRAMSQPTTAVSSTSTGNSTRESMTITRTAEKELSVDVIPRSQTFPPGFWT